MPASQTRESSESSFLEQALRDTKLVAHKSSLATRILFDNAKRATGVTIDTYGLPATLTARKEVLLTAGVFRSPHLLLLSGIGPAAQLRAQSVPVVADRPGVGTRLWDQPAIGPLYAVNVTTFSALGDPTFLDRANRDFLERQQDPLTNAGADYLGWEKLSDNYRGT